MQAAGYVEKDIAQKPAIFLNVAGNETMNVFNSMQIKPRGEKILCYKTAECSTPKTSETFEGYKFHK